MSKFKMTRRERDRRRAAKHSERVKALFPDEPPADMDEFRNALARKIAMFVSDRQGFWRGCPEPLCRRQRACLAPRILCSNGKPVRPSTPEQTARLMAQVQRALREVAARQEAGEK